MNDMVDDLEGGSEMTEPVIYCIGEVSVHVHAHVHDEVMGIHVRMLVVVLDRCSS